MPHGQLSMIMQCKRYLINLTTLAWNLRGGTQPVIGIQCPVGILSAALRSASDASHLMTVLRPSSLGVV